MSVEAALLQCGSPAILLAKSSLSLLYLKGGDPKAPFAKGAARRAGGFASAAVEQKTFASESPRSRFWRAKPCLARSLPQAWLGAVKAQAWLAHSTASQR